MGTDVAVTDTESVLISAVQELAQRAKDAQPQSAEHLAQAALHLAQAAAITKNPTYWAKGRSNS